MIGCFIAFMLLSGFAMFSAVNPEVEFNNPIEALEEKITRK